MPRLTPPADHEPHDVRSSRHDVAPTWLVGLLSLVVTTPAAALATPPSPPALDIALIRQLAQPQGTPSPGAGTATPPPTAPAAASDDTAADAGPAKPAVGSTPADVQIVAEPSGMMGSIAAPTASRAPEATADAQETTLAPTGQPRRSPLDVALIRQLAQPQVVAPSAPATGSAPVDVPGAAEPTGVIDTAGTPGVPDASADMTNDPTPRPAQPAEAVAAPVPPGAPEAPRTDRPAGQPFPLDRRVIASLASGDMGSVREESEPVTPEEATTPELPQTQLDAIQGVFAPEMQD